MGTAIAAVTDWLVAAALKATADTSTLVLDGWGPAQGTATASDTIIAIGRKTFSDDTNADNTQEVVVLGAGRVDEVFEIPCWVWASRPAANAKASRDAAVQVFDALAAAIAADRSLGRILQAGGYAVIGPVTLNQHGPGEDADAPTNLGSVELTFSIHCQNRYTP